MLKDTKAPTISQFLSQSFSRVSPAVARGSARRPRSVPRASTKRIGREEADALYQAIQKTKIKAPATDCISPIGEELLLKGLRHVVPGEFYCAATRRRRSTAAIRSRSKSAWPTAAAVPSEGLARSC
jgi:DNA topoisomerase VI subunit B